MGMVTAGNNVVPMTAAKIAGKMAFDCIDHVPGVQAN
jgi:hypothetical protein